VRNGAQRCKTMRTEKRMVCMGFRLLLLRRNPLHNPLIFPYKEEVGGSSPSTPTD